MPNHGRSGRCLTCKTRRVKCDEARPSCTPCRRLNLHCGGYAKTFHFRDQNRHFASSSPGKRPPRSPQGSLSPANSHPTSSTSSSNSSSSSPTSSTTSSVTSPPIKPQPSRSLLTSSDIAIPFFLLHYAGLGRGDLLAARGFYETLIPTYASQPLNSPLSLAVEAVAARILHVWRHDDNGGALAGGAITSGAGTVDVGAYSKPYTKAVAALRSALERPEERRRSATALAVLALHLYESVCAVWGGRGAGGVHLKGAVSLLVELGDAQEVSEAVGEGIGDGRYGQTDKGLDGLTKGFVRGFVLHTEISAALRAKRAVLPGVRRWVGGGLRRVSSSSVSSLESLSLSSSGPGNLSSKLDSIGAAIADLQADYVQGLSRRRHSPDEILELQRQCRSWITEAARIDALLQSWARKVPHSWHPLRLTAGRDFHPSIPAYRSACDIYPSCSIATLWNLWRCHRLLLLKISIGARRRISALSSLYVEVTDSQIPVPATTEGITTEGIAVKATARATAGVTEVAAVTPAQTATIQSLVDDITHSVPFYLGNRHTRSRLTDFSDPTILFPSLHFLAPDDPRIAARVAAAGENVLSRDEHHRHMLAYGAWHAVSPLSNLLALFADEQDDGQVLADQLRLGQREWIKRQFLRVARLLRLPVARSFIGDGHGSTGGGGEMGNGSEGMERDSGSVDSCAAEAQAAESLARQVRKGTKFMSGP